MDEHQCDKGPLIERLGSVLTRVDERTQGMAEEISRIKAILLGNGSLGLTGHVETHETRLDSVEASMLTHEVARKLLWKIGAMLVGSIGLTATIVELISKAKVAP